MSFTHLHVHSHYSLLDGKPSPAELAKKAKELGMTSLALTDHGYLYGVVDFVKACKAEGIKPIIGLEAYKSAESAFNRTPQNKKGYHLILLAKNETGYQNLVKLASFAATDGFYYRPRVDFDVLRKWHEGIICLSACVSGEIPCALLEDEGGYEKARELAKEYKDIFGEDFYLELQNHGLKDEYRVLPGLIALSKELDIPVVATNDVHYIDKKDANSQKMLMAIAWKKSKSADEYSGEDYLNTPPELYFKTEDEMRELFKDIPEAIDNTEIIADMCNFELKQGDYHLPKFPEAKIRDAGYKSSEEYFAAMCYEGLKKRYGDDAKKYEEQLEYEMRTIMTMGFADYFLIVSDFIKFAKRNGIYVGPGRGSAAGSMVSYCLEITELDPVRYGLVFERFLNPERVTMPDVDIDFEVPEGREAVINYVSELYGSDHVCQIITFTTLAGRSAVDDVARVLGTEKTLVESIKKLIPKAQNVRLGDIIKENTSLQKIYKSSKEAATLIAYAIRVEGALRQPSKHAAGVIIAPDSVTEYIPICRDNESKSMLISQYYMGSVEAVGMLKFDFLGLRNLTILKSAVQAVKEHTGQVIDLNNIPLDDPKVYEMLSAGDVSGVFQLESAGMRDVVMNLKPTSIEDIIAIVALYRPGPMDNIPAFIEYKHHPEKVTYPLPEMEPILKDTNSIMVYQEQVMELLRVIAGYSYGRSDLVRRIMSKKKAKDMEAEKEIFLNGQVDDKGNIIVPGAIRNGVPADVAEEIWKNMAAFASYAFNRAHAACYGFIAYQTAWMKVNYPLEYQAAMMTNAVDNPKKLAKQFTSCKKHDIPILRPSINDSSVDFSVEDNGIRYGLVATKGVGRAIFDEIVMERSYSPYTGMQNLVERCTLAAKKDVLEALIKSGALDGFGQSRAQMLLAVKPMLQAAAKARKDIAKGQMAIDDTFFKDENVDNASDRGIHMPPFVYADVPELPRAELLQMEMESTGMYISGHPLREYESEIQNRVTHDIGDLLPSDDEEAEDTPVSVEDGESVRLAGVISTFKEHMTKGKNQLMAFATLADETGDIELTIFPRTYDGLAGKLVEGVPVLVFGKLQSETYRDTVRRKVLVDAVEFLAEDAQPKNEDEQ